MDSNETKKLVDSLGRCGLPSEVAFAHVAFTQENLKEFPSHKDFELYKLHVQSLIDRQNIVISQWKTWTITGALILSGSIIGTVIAIVRL